MNLCFSFFSSFDIHCATAGKPCVPCAVTNTPSITWVLLHIVPSKQIEKFVPGTTCFFFQCLPTFKTSKWRRRTVCEKNLIEWIRSLNSYHQCCILYKNDPLSSLFANNASWHTRSPLLFSRLYPVCFIIHRSSHFPFFSRSLWLVFLLIYVPRVRTPTLWPRLASQCIS